MSAASAKCMAVAETIKRDGKDRDHDCIIGVSGGVDSSYLVLLAKEKLGLRPLIFHVDAGWNSQQSVNNIEKTGRWTGARSAHRSDRLAWR